MYEYHLDAVTFFPSRNLNPRCSTLYEESLKLTKYYYSQLRPPKSSLTLSVEDDENVEEEADEVVPDGVEEVELAKINLEKKEREQNLLLDDMKKLSFWCDTSNGKEPEKEPDLWMIYGGIAMLVRNIFCKLSFK